MTMIVTHTQKRQEVMLVEKEYTKRQERVQKANTYDEYVNCLRDLSLAYNKLLCARERARNKNNRLRFLADNNFNNSF